jgi:hypothetical protein
MKLGRPIIFSWTIDAPHDHEIDADLVANIVLNVSPNQQFYRPALRFKIYEMEEHANQPWETG